MVRKLCIDKMRESELYFMLNTIKKNVATFSYAFSISQLAWGRPAAVLIWVSGNDLKMQTWFRVHLISYQ